MKKSTDYSGKSGLYASVSPVKGFAQFLKAVKPLLEEEGVKLYDEVDFHCTLMYSRDAAPHMIRVTKMLNEGPFRYAAWSDCVEYWDGHDGDGYLVLKLISRDLMLRNEQYKDLGCKHSFPTYEAHITLADKLEKPKCIAEINRMLKNIKFEFVLGGEHVEDIKE